MNTRFLIVATLTVAAMLGACTSAAPTGPDARAVAPSFELSNSDSVPPPAAVDQPDAIVLCPTPSVDTTGTTGTVGTAGTFAVAYGTCTTTP